MAENDDIRWAVEDIKDRALTIQLYRDYYDGNHRAPWATSKWNYAFETMFSRFRDNLCPAVVDSKADRIQLTGFDAEGDSVKAAIKAIWLREKLETRQGEITKNALKDGDAFVIVWPDEAGLARWYLQRGDRICARYREDPQGELEVAAKIWPQEASSKDGKSNWRLNLYYSDRIERYATSSRIEGNEIPEDPAKWDEYLQADHETSDAGEEVAAPSVVDNPYGVVPVFPFPNNADTGAYGRSELRDIIPIQDALNKSVANMLIAGEFVAWPQRILIGVDVDTDEAGNPTGREQKQALDRILTIGNPNAKASEWAGADLAKFVAEQDSYRAEMARISRTPLHYLLLTGDFPSGEALGAAERPLMAQIDDRILNFKPRWQDPMSLSLTIERVTHDPATLDATFKDTRYKSPESTAEDLRVKKEMGVPDEQLWKEMGYSAEEIEEFAALKEERALTMQAAFNAGTPDTINPEAEPPGAFE